MGKLRSEQFCKRLASSWSLLACLAWCGWAAELPRGFVAETVATNLNASTAFALSPDGRIFLNDQTGKLLVWKNGAVLAQPALTLHVTDYWERGLNGVALPPDFPKTPHVYLLYVTDRPFVHHVLSRFTMTGDVIDPASERILLEGDDQAKLGGTQPGGHQGGPMRFGNDGKLYVCIGEQTAGEPSQRLDTLQGKILRLNADGSIPEDNPFMTRTSGKYRAICVYGVRNSFGLAQQPREDGGRFFFTDVGGSAFEEVNELVPGANYGWPKAEGYSTRPEFKPPLYAYPPLIGQSICGATFYPSKATGAFPEKWRGKFFFVDFMKHWVKALDPSAPTNVINFAKGFNGPIAVEVAADGSLLVLERGTIWRDMKRFVPNSGALVRIKYVGETLSTSEANGRTSTTDIKPALGLPVRAAELPKELHAEEWEQRLKTSKKWPLWVYNESWHPLVAEFSSLFLPPGAKVTIDLENACLQLPPGAVVVRRFSVNTLIKGSQAREAEGQLMETRLLVIGSARSYGASYRWKNTRVAELVEDGEFATFRVAAEGLTTYHLMRNTNLNWWFPAMEESASLPAGSPSYWVSTALSDFTATGTNWSRGWLMGMKSFGIIANEAAVEQSAKMPPGIMWQNPRESAEQRVRSFLHGNCATCHQPGGLARAFFDARLSTPLEKTGLLNGELAAGDLGINGAKVIVPGNLEKSILYQRLKRTDFFRMPPVQYHNEAPPILPVLAEWIQSLKTP